METEERPHLGSMEIQAEKKLEQKLAWASRSLQRTLVAETAVP